MIDTSLLNRLAESFGFTKMVCEDKMDTFEVAFNWPSPNSPLITEISFDGAQKNIESFLNALKVYGIEFRGTLYNSERLRIITDRIEIEKDKTPLSIEYLFAFKHLGLGSWSSLV